MLRRARLVLAVAVLAPLALPASPQPPVPSFGEKVEVTVVNVEVYVTDRDGNPIRGLAREDFTLLEDGKPVEITNFSAFEGGASIEMREGTAGIEPAPAAAPLPEHRLSLVIYVDNLHLQPASRKRALAQVREFLGKSFPPGSQVMVVSYEFSPKVIQPFTSDLNLALSRLDELVKGKAIGVANRAARQTTLSQIRSIYDNDGCSEFALDQMKALANSYARPLAHEDAQSFTALSAVIGSIAGVAGRKAVFHVSDGVPLVSGQEAFGLLNSLCEGSVDTFANSDLSHDKRLRRLGAQANAAGVTFYTLEATGLRSPLASSVEQARPTLSASLESDSIANEQDVLFNLADETGGRALLNTNKLETALVAVGRDLANFYSLGYAVSRAADGRVHALEVEVRREGARVQHRHSYRDKTADDRREERVLATLLLSQEDNPLGAALEPGPVVREKNQVLMPIRLRVPMARLALLPQDGGSRAGKLRLAMAARDAEGGTTPVRTVEVPLAVPEAQAEAMLARDFLYEVRMAMRPGPHRVALAIEDVPTGVTSYLALDFEVPKK